MVSNYSFIDNILAGSAQPDKLEDIEQYIEDGITDIVSLTPRLPLVSKYIDSRIRMHHIPVYGLPDTTQVKEFLDILDVVKMNEGKLVVHCQYGQERTGIMLATYLIERVGLKFKEAVYKIREIRPSSLRTHSSISFLTDKYG